MPTEKDKEPTKPKSAKQNGTRAYSRPADRAKEAEASPESEFSLDEEFAEYTATAREGALLREVESRFIPVLERVYDLRETIAAAKAELDLIEPRYIELYTELTKAAQTAFRFGATVKELAGHPLDRLGYWTLRNIVYRRDKPLKSVHFKLPPDPRKAPPKRTRPSQKKPKDAAPEA